MQASEPFRVLFGNAPRARAAGLVLSLLIATVTLASGQARAGCFFWDCCDQWGYNFPHGSKNGCEDDGGYVQCDGGCPGQGGPVWKCCDENHSDKDGVYLTRHACKVDGGFVEEDVLFCSNNGPFRCCDPVEGGSAPWVYTSRASCTADGYVARDWSLGVCPGGFLADVLSPFHDMFVRPFCAMDIREAYQPKGVTYPTTQMGQWDAASGEPIDWVAVQTPNPDAPVWKHNGFTDKDSHCIMSCLVTLQCGKATAALAGWARETYQMCDSAEANGWGSGDECANQYGRDYGEGLALNADVVVNDAAGNPIPNITPEVLACRDYCTGLDMYIQPPIAGVEPTLCTPSHLATDLGPLDAENATAFNIAGYLTTGAMWWLIKKCDDGYLGGLTVATALADAIAGLKTAGASLTAAAGSLLAVGETGTFEGGALMHRLGANEYALSINVPGEEVDAYVTYLDGQVSAMRLRGASGDMMLMTSAAPVEVGCPGPQCEKRVSWMQWRRVREPVSAIIPNEQ